MHIRLYVSILCLFTCCSNIHGKINTYDEFRSQKLEIRDSLFIFNTVREWGKDNWWIFEDYSRNYKMSNDDIQYFNGGVFYSPDRKKIIIWYGKKLPNATSKEIYDSQKPERNRICPMAGDTIYNMSALIGFRDDTNSIWQIYPLENETVICSATKDEAINVLCQYYFEKMKDHEMWKIIQFGKHKGEFELKRYEYNLQDKEFWDKCWIWQVDSVGSYNLYPFQVRSYGYGMKDTCLKCADPIKLPKIEYPEAILELYHVQTKH